MRKILSYSLLALVVAGCSDDPITTPAELPDPVLAISDGAHSDGNGHFFFLPPMVRNPHANGVFNPNLSPRVEICVLTADECDTIIATYTMEEGTHGQVVKLHRYDDWWRHLFRHHSDNEDGENGHYQVNWFTDAFELDDDRNYRISVFQGSLELGFADVNILARWRELWQIEWDEEVPLKDGWPLPIRFRIEEGALAEAVGCTEECGEVLVSVDPATGESEETTVLTTNGVAGGFFPPGAVPLSAEIPNVVVVFELVPLEPGVRCLDGLPTQFQEQVGCYRARTIPEGVVFNEDVTVGFCIEGFSLFPHDDDDLSPDLRVYREDDLGLVQALPRVPLPFQLNCDNLLGDKGGNPLWNFASNVVRGVAEFLSPEPLSANSGMMINRGMGGSTGFFSRFVVADDDFFDGFEEESGWIPTGFWNRGDASGITNDAVTASLVNLAPADATGGSLPAPQTGAGAFWYGDAAGDPHAGNYIGMAAAGQGAGSGGTSTSGNNGTITSPEIPLPPDEGKNIILRFDAWFEIESVNPSSFDIMSVSVYDVAAATTTSFGMLNPGADPSGGAAPRPFSSGGFDLPPVWAQNSVDVSAFAGKTIQLVFEFDTRDALYNGFRGWLLDNVRIVQEAPMLAAAFLQSAAEGNSGILNPISTVSAREQ